MRHKVVQNGVLVLGIYNDGDMRSLVTLCFNDGTIVFNNFNRGNAASWTEKIPMVGGEISSGKFSKERWYRDFKRLLASGKITKEYCAMVEKLNGCGGKVND